MKYIFLAILSAVLLSISWPIYGVPFFIFVAFVPLLFMEHFVSQDIVKRKGWGIFGCSYLAFMIWNIVTTGWLYYAQNSDGSPALMAVIFPVLVNSLLMSATFQFYYWFKKNQKLSISLVFFVAVWMCFEKFHMEWEFTWPWLNLGNVFADYPRLIQWYDTFGATGGSFWILTVNILIFYGLEQLRLFSIQKRFIGYFVMIFGIIIIPMLFSFLKYENFNEKSMGQVKVMMLQPNLDPYTEKYQKDSLQIVQELLDLAQNSSEKIDYYIAPETAFPGSGGLSEKGFHHSQSIHLVQNFLMNHPKSIFVGGVSTYNIYRSEEEKTETSTYYPQHEFWIDHYNSAMQIIPYQKFEIYHKGKLVPGVEIFPYMNVLKPLLGDAMLNFGGAVTSLGRDKDRKIFLNSYQQGKPAPIICYESIYGDFVTEYVKKGANFLAIMTNDSWWGVSQGYKQLLAYARLRAIETRREIARAANSGISAHIDARGEILSQTLYGQKTALTANIKLYQGESIYVRIGDVFFEVSILIFGVLLVFKFFRLMVDKNHKKFV